MCAASPSPAVVRLLARFQQDRLEASWDAMRTLLHPEGRFESLAAVGRVLSADELIDAIRQAASRGMYSVPTWEIELLGPHVAIVEGRVRYRVGETGLTDEARAWITTEHDELIWRMRIFADRRMAIGCWHDSGRGLGL